MQRTKAIWYLMDLLKTLSLVRRKYLKIWWCTLTCSILAEFSTSFLWSIYCIGSDTRQIRHSTSSQEERWQLSHRFQGSLKENRFSICLQRMKKFWILSVKLATWQWATNKMTRGFCWCLLCSCISSRSQIKQDTEWHHYRYLWKSKVLFALKLWCLC